MEKLIQVPGSIHMPHNTPGTCSLLNFEQLFVLDAPVIEGHKTLTHLLPYLLFVHVSEFLVVSLSPFSARFFIGMILGFVECLGLF